MDGGEVVEDGLQLVLLHPRADHHQLLDEPQDVGPGGVGLFFPPNKCNRPKEIISRLVSTFLWVQMEWTDNLI